MPILRSCLRLLGLAGASIALAACSAPAPFQSTTPADVRLQKADLPAGLSRCPGSGDIGAYLKSLRGVGGSGKAYADGKKEWDRLRSIGATAADVEMYADRRAACGGTFGSDPRARAAFSYVVQYKDQNAAARAFSSGFLGLQPQPGQQEPGLEEGAATGLGNDSWSYTQVQDGVPAYLAFWHQKDFTIFLGTTNMTAAGSDRLAVMMNGRAG